MLNLFDYLSPLDNKRIENYISIYGIISDQYCGNQTYLKYWAKCKPHLFHLLGGELIYKFPVSLEKSQSQIRAELDCLLTEEPLLGKYLKCLEKTPQLDLDNETKEVKRKLRSLTYYNTFENDRIPYTIKFKLNGQRKTLQLQEGMKPIRALQKVINYFKWDELLEELESFRIAQSMILNDKTLKGNLCISIHPLDFLTMSDNNSGWSSCMSWMKGGCYQIGTVEMMNSNNTVCCYLESSVPYYFKEGEDDPSWNWNNKKWRQLFYITKDIAVCGKAYPYQNKELSLLILDKIKELTEKNLHKTYTFGPEPYRDMVHIGSNFRMQQNKYWIFIKDTKKHNIIFDTKGMYNDMFNDHEALEEDLYWCYRNKVKHNIVVSCSGKSLCLCCGTNEIIEENDLDSNYEGAYNDRYYNVGELLCKDCLKHFKCDCCKKSDTTRNLIKVEDSQICPSCAERLLKECSSCGNPFISKIQNNQLYLKTVEDEELFQQDFRPVNSDNEKKVFPLYMCQNCRDKNRGYFKKITPKIDPARSFYGWLGIQNYWVSKSSSFTQWEKYLKENLSPCFKEV